jgi:hypothetical protein
LFLQIIYANSFSSLILSILFEYLRELKASAAAVVVVALTERGGKKAIHLSNLAVFA